jgi:PKD repeat protein
VAPTADPRNPYDNTYMFNVPKSTELLVVVLDTNARSRNDFISTFTGPGGQVVARSKLKQDTYFPGNPYYAGIEELMHLARPAEGSWMLTVHLTARFDYAAHVKATALFHLHMPPLAEAQAAPNSGRAPLVVSFDASGSQLDGGTATYCWQFTDDQSYSWGVHVTHVFRRSGTFQALLTVTDDQGRQGFNHAEVWVTT